MEAAGDADAHGPAADEPRNERQLNLLRPVFLRLLREATVKAF
jgi:hypothetical protein